MSSGYVAIGTQQLSLPVTEEPGYPWDEHVPPSGRDATLLAVVPIPGTQTSLAIVGYVVHTSGKRSRSRSPQSASRTRSRSHLPGY